MENTNFTNEEVMPLGAFSDKVKIAVTDMDGVLRGKYISRDKFKSAEKDGMGFCSVIFGWDSGDEVYDNSSYTGWHTGYPDATVFLDPKTKRNVPWDKNVPFYLGDFWVDKKTPLEICPRQVLKKVIRELDDLGYSALVGCEYEWFNFKETNQSLEQKGYQKIEPLTSGMFGYSILRMAHAGEYFNDLFDKLKEFRIPIEGLHTETGPGVYEAAITACDPLESADRAVLFKTAVKEIALKYGIVPSFMAKWNNKLPGCSGHLHLSLTNNAKENLFYDETNNYAMSPLFESFLAGLLKCTGDILPMMAPNVNSYKRLVDGYWAPVAPTWGIDNRTCAFRVINTKASATRVEVRVPGADMNPYLSMAAALSAGLYGIKNNLKLNQAPIKNNGYEQKIVDRFPKNLEEAALRMKNSTIAHEMLGENFVSHFTQTRLWEASQAHKAIWDWELKRYFEII